VTIPCEVTGSLPSAGDDDWLEFDAPGDFPISLEVIAHRLGHPMDTTLLVQKVTIDGNGNEVAQQVARIDDPPERNRSIGSEFDMTTDDPKYVIPGGPPATYRVLLRDQFATSKPQSGRHYRLAIRPSEADFQVAAVTQRITTPPNANQILDGGLVIRRGGTTSIDVRLLREGGFGGQVDLSVEGLPASVSTRGAVIGENADRATLILSADDNAPGSCSTLRIVGRGHYGDQEIVREARGGCVVWGTSDRRNQPARFRITRDIVLSVVESETPPVSADLGNDQLWETSRGGQLEIPLRVTRREGFAGDLTFVAKELPGELKVANLVVKADATEGKVALNVNNAKTPLGTYTMHLRADSQHKRVRNPNAVAIAENHHRQLETRVKELNEALQAAEGDQERVAALRAELSETEQSQQAAAKRLAEVNKANEPRDTRFVVLSTPTKIRIARSPIHLTVSLPEQTMRPEGHLDIPVAVERRFGFTAPVQLTIKIPATAKGLKSEAVTLAANEDETQLRVEATESAAAARHSLVIQATAKFNNVPVDASHEIQVQVESDPGE
jgi:hypothetical protein